MSYLGGRTIYIDSDGNEHFDYERDYEPKPLTNYDRIVSQTPEELAEWIAGGVLNLTGASLKMAAEAWADWLRREVADGT